MGVIKLNESKIIKFQDLIDQIDRLFPWYFLAMVLFFSSISGTLISITVYFSQAYYESLMIPVMRIALIFTILLLPIYGSTFIIVKISNMYKIRNRLHDYIHYIYDEKREKPEEEQADEMFWTTRRDIEKIPRYIFLSYLLLIVSAVIILILIPFYPPFF